MPNNAKLLSQFTDLTNVHGDNSKEVKAFLKKHKKNTELVGLCERVLIVKAGFKSLYDTGGVCSVCDVGQCPRCYCD